MNKLIVCLFLSLVAVLNASVSSAESGTCDADLMNCKAKVNSVCSGTENNLNRTVCGSKYSGFQHAERDIQKYVFTLIEQSFQLLTLSTKFGNYKSNRPGFEKLYRHMADESWEEGIELMKYITSRGYYADFKTTPFECKQITDSLRTTDNYHEISELKSLSLVLDMKKFLATKAHDIHRMASHEKEVTHDAEVMSYIENNFVHKQANTIRTLSGYIHDLHSITQTPGVDANLATYMFDEYLLKA